jgi:phage protein D
MTAPLSRLVPHRRVSVDGKPLEIAEDAALVKVEVDLDQDLFGQCVLQFVDPGLELIDGGRFQSGSKVKVELGFLGELRPLFEGEVVALEPCFQRDKPPALRVVCQDPLHRLALSQMTRALNDVDDAEVVSLIARKHGLQGEGPRGSRSHQLQSNISDAAFLRRMAQRNGHQLRIEQGKLMVGPPSRREEIAVEPGAGLRKLNLKINGNRQVGEVTAHGWDPAARREIIGTARPEGEGGEGARAHGGDRSIAIAGHGELPIDTASAEAMARARLRKLAEGFVTVRLEMIGDARAVPGATLKLDKIDPAGDGTFRIEKATHLFSRHGYFTTLKAVRVAKKQPPRPIRQTTPAQPEEGWLEVELIDHDGRPVAGEKYKVQTSDGRVVEGRLDAQGRARVVGVRPGSNTVSFPDFERGWQRE